MAGVEFTIYVEWERESGKFATRDDLVTTIEGWLEAANEEQIDGVGSDGDSTYNIIEWAISENVKSK